MVDYNAYHLTNVTIFRREWLENIYYIDNENARVDWLKK